MEEPCDAFEVGAAALWNSYVAADSEAAGSRGDPFAARKPRRQPEPPTAVPPLQPPWRCLVHSGEEEGACTRCAECHTDRWLRARSTERATAVPAAVVRRPLRRVKPTAGCCEVRERRVIRSTPLCSSPPSHPPCAGGAGSEQFGEKLLRAALLRCPEWQGVLPASLSLPDPLKALGTPPPPLARSFASTLALRLRGPPQCAVVTPACSARSTFWSSAGIGVTPRRTGSARARRRESGNALAPARGRPARAPPGRAACSWPLRPQSRRWLRCAAR